MKAYLWMLFGTFNFATMGALSHSLALGRSDWRLVALARAALMLLFAVPIAMAAGAKLTLRGCPTLWVRSISGSVGLLGMFYTLTHLHISESITLLNLTPIWVAILSWAYFRERPALKVCLAIAVGAVGVVLIARPHFDQARVALVVGGLSSICTAVAVLSLTRVGHLDAHAVVVHFSAVATATTAVYFLASGQGLAQAIPTGAPDILKLLGVGLTGTVGQIALTRAFAQGDASRVSIVGLTQLLFAVGYDRLIWDREYTAGTLAGMVLVAAPTAWLLTRPRATPGSASPPAPGAPAALP